MKKLLLLLSAMIISANTSEMTGFKGFHDRLKNLDQKIARKDKLILEKALKSLKDSALKKMAEERGKWIFMTEDLKGSDILWIKLAIDKGTKKVSYVEIESSNPKRKKIYYIEKRYGKPLEKLKNKLEKLIK